MTYLSGSPMYNYELARELKRRGNEVVLMSDWENPTREGKKMRLNLEKEGVECVQWTEEKKWKFDLWIASEMASLKAQEAASGAPMINVVHSEYEVESPIPDIPFAYVCIRPEIKDHIVNEHGIPKEKCHVIYNGIDRNRFKKVKRNLRYYRLTVVPCTFDELRRKFIEHIAKQADKYNQVHFYGKQYGVEIEENDYVKVFPETFDIQEPIANADEVAGILLGRVNLEANSCHVPSWMYDPVTLEKKKFLLPEKEFDKKHNIKNVAKKILDIARMDDITIIIPHYSQQEMLANILKDLVVMKNVIVMKTGSFAENCNQGAKIVETKYVVFLNDDTRIEDPAGLFAAMKEATKKADIVGCRATYGVNGTILKGKRIIPIMDTESKVRWPAGHCLMMTKATFKKLGGYDETFVNGCEDTDMFLRAEKMGMKIKTIDIAIEHIGSQSEGRFANIKRNVMKFNKRWGHKAKVPHKHSKAPAVTAEEERPQVGDKWETI
jgi:hypothetical protein